MAEDQPKKDAQVIVTSYLPDTKLNLHERVGDYLNAGALGKSVGSASVDKDGEAVFKNLEEGKPFWVVPAGKEDAQTYPGVAVIAKKPPEKKKRVERKRELQGQAVPQPIQARQIVVGPRSTKTTAPQVDAGPEPKKEGQVLLEDGEGQDFGTKDYEQAERARYAGLSDVAPHPQRPGGSSDGRENPSYSGAESDGIKQAWGGDGSSVHRTSANEASTVAPAEEDKKPEPVYPDEALTRSGRQSFEEQAKPGSSTVRADPTIDTKKSKGAGKPPTKSKEGLVNPTLQDNQAPASELAPPVEEEQVQPPSKVAARKAVEGERKQQRGQEQAREKEAK